MNKLLLLILILIFTSCTKAAIEPLTEPDTKISEYRSLSTLYPIYQQSTRISLWLLFDSSNYIEARADYAELHLSDTLSNSITSADEIKTWSGYDHLAIYHNDAFKYLSKEYRQYLPDTIQLNTYRLLREHYWIRAIANNVPSVFKIYLLDTYTGEKILLPGNNISTWYLFKTRAINYRFRLIIERNVIS